MGDDKLLFEQKIRFTPKDNLKYIIPSNAISNTEMVISEYGNINPPNEGLVYWGGRKEDNTVSILMVITPKTNSNSGRVSTSNRSNFDVVKILNDNQLIEIGQVHSHPGNWVDHSWGDDEWASCRINGLLSIVVPNYGQNGMLPLTSCGIHRYEDENFIRFTNKYVTKHFFIIDNLEDYSYVDLRYK